MAGLSKLEKKYEGALKRMRTLREKAKQPLVETLETGVTMGGSFGFGYLAGRYGDLELGGVPLLLVGGGVGHLGAMLIPRRQRLVRGAVRALAASALSAYANHEGWKLGLEAAVEEVGGEATLGSVLDNRERGLNDDGTAIENGEAAA